MIPDDLEPVTVWPDDTDDDGSTIVGFLGATAHDRDDHRRCDPDACPNAEPAS